MSSSKITINDVAKRAGVSIATVSRFLNNFPLRKENRERVGKAVEELNYQPSLYARRLAGGKLDTFGLIIPGYEGIFHSFYALEILRETAAILGEKGIDLHLNTFWNKDNFKSSLVDGVLMADIIGNEKQLQRLIKEEIPVVILNHNSEDKSISCVSIDNFKAGYEATEFLINHGHRRIIHLAGDLRVQCSKERLQGYKKAMEKGGIELKKEFIVPTNFSRKEAREKLGGIFRNQPPTAIFCCSDEVAIEVLSFAEEKKIKVPNDLSIIGFDDNPHCAYGNVMLTTLRQPLKPMVAKGVEVLKDILEKDSQPQNIVLDCELIIRDTVTFV